MKNKIVLFYPDVMEESFGLDKDLRTIIKIPIVMLALSGFLDKDGYEIVIIDQRIETNYLDLINKHVPDAICFGISCMMGYQIKNGLNVAKIVKRQFSDIPIVWGGWHPTMLSEQTMQSEYVDYVVSGQGEVSLYKLVQFFQEKIDIKDIPGVYYKKGSDILNTGHCKPTKLVDLSPLPYHLLDLERYFRTEPKRIMPYISSNGCPWKCAFCCIRNIYGRRWDPLPAERIVKEIIFLKKKYDIELIDFFDTNTFTDQKRMEQICLGFIENKINIEWWGSVRADQFKRYDDDFLRLLKESGCSQLSIGGESGDQAVLDMLDKEIKVEEVVDAAKRLTALDIEPAISFIVGLPKENVYEDFKKTKELVLLLNTINPNIGIQFYFYIPNVGTPLYERSLRYGLKEPSCLEGWANYIYQEGVTPWLEEDFVREVNEYRLNVSERRYDKELRDYRKEIYDKKIIQLLEKLIRSQKIGKNVIVYGASDTGKLSKDFLEERGMYIIGFGDKFKGGQTLDDKPIYSICELEDKKPDTIIIATLAYADQIYNDIKFLEKNGTEILRLC